MRRLEIRSPFDAPVLYIPETGSTMDEAKRYTRELGTLPAHGTVVLTDYQREGRGRVRSRSWESPPGESILVTVILHRDGRWPVSSLSIRTALAISLFLERHYGLFPRIKWPNDVLVNGRKISGVLCEAGAQLVYAGIGLNCRSRRAAGAGPETGARAETGPGAEGGLGAPADRRFGNGGGEEKPRTSIHEETGADVQPREELPKLLDELAAVLDLEDLTEAERRLYGRGEELSLSEGCVDSGHVVWGVVEGIDEEGALLMRSRGEGVPYRVVSGEFLPQAGGR